MTNWQGNTARLLRKLGWHRKHGTIRRRLYDLADDRHPWWDWGNRLMILTGTDFGGNWKEPTPGTWWYVATTPKRMARTGYPRHRYEIVTDYDEFRRRTEGLNEDQLYDWRAVGFSQDGDLTLGRRYWGGDFHGLDYAEQLIVARYLRRWRCRDWWGLRTWLYLQGLHAAVHQRKPFSCHQVPPRGQGGYDHWHCQRRRGHDGLHRYRACVWGDLGGEQLGVTHVPEEAFD